jgi:hypothetical protein
MLQFENEFVKVELVSNSKILLLTWMGFIPSVKYRDACEKALEIAKKHRVKEWLSDIKQVKVVSPTDQEWVVADWAPRAVAAGCYNRQAILMPDDIFGQVSANKMIVSIKGQSVEMQNFNNLEAAKEWLLSPVAI